MGNKDDKAQAPQPTFDDAILEMRLTSKKFEMESKRSIKEKDQQLKKAKEVEYFLFHFF